MAEAEQASILTSDSFSPFPETAPSDAERQFALVAQLGVIVANVALTADQRETAVAELRNASGYGTLEFRMLHMFALHATQLAIQDR